MANVGILTFSRSPNYGSSIQAWALTKVLTDLGGDPEILDYVPRGYAETYALLPAPRDVYSLSYDVLHLLMLRYFKRRTEDFQRFWERFYTKTDCVLHSSEALREREKKYQAVVCGSDQIWNTQAKVFDMEYMFPGLTGVRKISYAVSINEGTVEDNEDYRRWLSDFHRLSVREPNSREQLKKLLGDDREVRVTLDPTLLLRAEDYRPLMASPVSTEPYIFFYSLRTKDFAMQAAERLSTETGLPVYTLIAGPGSIFYLKHRKTLRLPRSGFGPDMFLSLLGNAAYVVTDSFHGTALSIVFHKPFCAVAREKGDGQIEKNVRLDNILSIVQLSDRYVPADKIMECIGNEIDWERVDRLRMAEAEKSIAFLREALDGIGSVISEAEQR